MGTIYKSGIPYSGGGGGSSLPDGGTTGQALVKKSDTNQDVEWKNIGSGGGAEFSIDSASNSGVVGQGNDYFSVNLNGEDTVDLSLIQPNVYGKTKTVPTKEYVDSKAIVQVDTMPTASATEEGKIYQYVGATTADYINGYFYKCVEEGAISPDPITYKWVAINVQSGGSETLDEVLTNGNEAIDKSVLLKNSTDNGTTEIDSYAVIQRYDDGAGLGNFASLSGGTLQMSETNSTDDSNAYIGAKHMNMSSTDSNGDPLNHFVMEWSDVANVDMSDDLKEAWRNALGGGVGMSQEVIYSANATVGTDVQETTKPVTDYDMLVVSINIKSSETDIQNHNMIILPSQIVFNTGSIRYTDGTTDRYVVYRFNDATHFQAVTGNGYWITKITGISFGSKLDGTIGRWEKIGEYVAGGTTTLSIPNFADYNAFCLSVKGSPTREDNSAVILASQWEVGTPLQATIMSGEYITATRATDTTITFSTRNAGVLYGYKETAISDADVQRIAQEVPSKSLVVNITNNSGTYVADKTFAEIHAIIQDGGTAHASYDNRLYGVGGLSSSEIRFENTFFQTSATYDNNVVYGIITIKSDETITLRLDSARTFIYADTYPIPSAFPEGTFMLSGVSVGELKAGSWYRNVKYGNEQRWVMSLGAEAVPMGGTMGQVLTKSSNADFAVEWKDTDEIMKVTFTGATTIQSADKTFSEIKEALDAGKFVYAQRNTYTGYTGGSEVLYRVYRYDSSEIIFINNMMAYYGAASPAPNKDITEEVVLTSGNVISSRRHAFAPIYYAEGGAPNPTTSELASIMLAGTDNTTYNTKKGGLYINQVVSGARTWVPISEPVESTVDVTKVHSNRVDVTDSSSEVQLEFNNEIYGVGIRAEDSSGQIMYQQLANTQIVDNKISNAISPFKDGSSYSATEKQVGTYMGNTPLYQITAQTTVTNTTADGTTASKQVTVLPAVENIVSIEGIINVNGRYETITNVSELNDKVLGCTVAVNAGNATILEIKNNLMRLSDKPLYVTIKYTKTT